MANIYRNFFQRGASDVWGDGYVLHETGSGEHLLVSRPRFDENSAYSETQDAHQAVLRASGTYASFAEAKEVYCQKACGTGVTPYFLAMIDWFGAPRLLEIDVDRWTGLPGETLRVKARDNVLVARVDVAIRDAHGQLREIGGAIQESAGSAWWCYTTQSRVPMSPFPVVQAIAWDLPGNRTSFVIS